MSFYLPSTADVQDNIYIRWKLLKCCSDRAADLLLVLLNGMHLTHSFLLSKLPAWLRKVAEVVSWVRLDVISVSLLDVPLQAELSGNLAIGMKAVA